MKNRDVCDKVTLHQYVNYVAVISFVVFIYYFMVIVRSGIETMFNIKTSPERKPYKLLSGLQEPLSMTQTLKDAHETEHVAIHTHTYTNPSVTPTTMYLLVLCHPQQALLFEAIQHSECVVKHVWIYVHTNNITDQRLSCERGCV